MAPLPPNFPNSSFKQVKPNLFVSDLIDIKPNGTGTIYKPLLDYGSMLPTKHPYIYNGGTHMFHIHRFMKFNYLKKSLNSNSVSLVFISPDKWLDPFEHLLYNAQKPLTCMCCTYERTEAEEAAWNRSKFENDPFVRVSFDYNKFCDFLSTYGSQNNVSFYVTVANYSNSIEQIRNAQKLPVPTSDAYVNLLSLKRKAFAYENELRIFAIGGKTNNGLLEVKLNCKPSDLISFITLPPYPPFSKEDVRNPYYGAIQYIHNVGMRKEIEKYFSVSSIWQSHLYECKKTDATVNKLKKII